ncbi:hypothetical protein Tsubulata_025981 [Turnera subulata]|uniref:Helicase ATP-binding domain-containing protein n=1 Tax=Turnera subulata TaxID=218843 RepID=A0A9Q0FSZ4_9ROSI|nr:hypothetical protein Tsubulata_025981 [Turnera subulata]
MQFLGVNTLTEYLFVFFHPIAVTACVPDAWPALILAPSSLGLHWASMIQQWLNIPSSDILVVIADESHFLKNAQAKRTTDYLPVIKKAQCAILFSGTPALSRPIELFKQLEALYPGVYKNVYEYGNRYCKGGRFGVYQGASNHEELHNLMKSTVMIHRLKKDVLAELPVKRRQQLFLDLAKNDMKQINALFREKKKVGCIRIDGSAPAASWQTLVSDFQEKDNIRAAVLSIKAGGGGLTLIAASTEIFAELSWTPGDLIQAEDRAHRIGQLRIVSQEKLRLLMQEANISMAVLWVIYQWLLMSIIPGEHYGSESKQNFFC